MTDAIFILDARHPPAPPTIRDCNDAASRMFSYEKTEMLGKPTRFLHVSEDTLRTFQTKLYAAVKQQQLPLHLSDFRMKRKDGSVFPSEHSVNQILDEHGKRVGWVSIVRDITQSKALEEKIQSLAKFPAENPNPVFRLNKNGIVLDANDASIPLFDEWQSQIGRSLPQFEQVLTEVFLSGQSTNVDLECGGRIYAFFVKPVLGLGYANVYGRDITDRKRLEAQLLRHSQQLEELVEARTAELKTSEQKYRQLVENTSDAIFTIDLQGNYTYVSPGAEKLTQYSTQQLLSMNIRQLTTPDYYPKILERLQTRIRGETPPSSVEIEIVKANGERVPIEMQTSPLRDRQGRVVGIQGIARDITENKQMQETILKNQRMATIGELAAMVGHDLRNPLQAIAGATYLLKMQGPEMIDRMEPVQIIERNVTYSDNIINDLLTYGAEIKLQPSSTNPHLIITNTLSLTGIPRNIQVVNESETKPKFVADVDKLQRALLNVVKNAIDAMPKGGTLSISSKQTGQHVEFVISDSGAGMNDTTLSRLWTPLFTTKAKGMGFGLAIAKRIIEAQNGSISAKSTLGQGSTFTIQLPIKSDELKQ